MAIFNYLAGTESHPSPDEVYENIRVQLPSISLATVYKVLDQFHRQGFLRRVSTEGQVARYDARMEQHHHLICNHCGKIRDLGLDPDTSRPSLPEVADFRIERSDILFHGLGRTCQDSEASLPA